MPALVPLPLVTAQDPATCTACAKARVSVSGLFFTYCDGCLARQIAETPQAYDFLAAGRDKRPLQELVAKVFPRERGAWAVGAIKDWFTVLQTRGPA